jgi:hypothetical protein
MDNPYDIDAEIYRLNTYDDDDECYRCGAHVSDPHAAGCPNAPAGAPTGGVLRNRPAPSPFTSRALIELIADHLVGVTLATDNAPGLIIGIPDETGPNGMREFIVEAREV